MIISSQSKFDNEDPGAVYRLFVVEPEEGGFKYYLDVLKWYLPRRILWVPLYSGVHTQFHQVSIHKSDQWESDLACFGLHQAQGKL